MIKKIEEKERPRIRPPEIRPRPAPVAPQPAGAAPQRFSRPGGRGGRSGRPASAGNPVHTPKSAIKPRELMHEPAGENAAAVNTRERRDDILRFVPLGGL